MPDSARSVAIRCSPRAITDPTARAAGRASMSWEYQMINVTETTPRRRSHITRFDPIAVVEIDEMGRGGGGNNGAAMAHGAATGEHRRGQSRAGASRPEVPRGVAN